MLASRHRLYLIAASVCAIGSLAPWHSAAGQSGGRQVMIVNDDGGGPVIRHFSMPDLMDLREPDFTRRDLPIFQEKLVLSEAQTAAMQRQITVYLDAFEQLKKSMLSFPGAEPMIVGPMGIMDGAEGPAPGEDGGAAIIVGPGGGELPAISLDELDEMDGEMGIDIGLRVTADDGGESDAGQPTVRVSIQSSADLPEEVRKKLEEQASAIAAKIMAQIEEQQKQGEGGDGAPPPLPGLDDVSKFEERRAQIEEAAKNFRKAKSQLRQEFVAEAQSTLTDEQLNRWPALERALLREKSLPKGRISGERTDLFKIIRPLALDQSHHVAIAPQLDAYDVELDSALRQRNSVLEEVRPKIDQAMASQDFDRALAAIDRAIAARIAVRSINERYIDAIAAQLPEELSAAFRSATLKAGYPQIYRHTYADRVFEAATALEGVDEQTLQRIREFEQVYRLERQEHDARIRRAIDKHQPLEPRRPIEHLRTVGAGEEPGRNVRVINEDDPVREAFARRRELDERYAKMVASLLTPEQVAHLPKPPAPRTPGEPIIIRKTNDD